jgi:hypothetical protein
VAARLPVKPLITRRTVADVRRVRRVDKGVGSQEAVDASTADNSSVFRYKQGWRKPALSLWCGLTKIPIAV